MRNAVIGLFPGQVLKDKDSAEVETGILRLRMGRLRAAFPFLGAHGSEQKPEQQNYARHRNALAVHTIWLRVGKSDLSLPTKEKTEQVTDTRKQCNRFISLPAGGIQTGKTCCLGRAARGRRCSYCLSLGLSFSFELLSGETSPSSLPND